MNLNAIPPKETVKSATAPPAGSVGIKAFVYRDRVGKWCVRFPATRYFDFECSFRSFKLAIRHLQKNGWAFTGLRTNGKLKSGWRYEPSHLSSTGGPRK